MFRLIAETIRWCDIEGSFSGRKSSAKIAREPSGTVAQRTTTSACKEKQRLHHNLQLRLSSEKDCSVSDKPVDTLASVEQSTESGECQSSKLSGDELKSLVNMDSKPQNTTRQPSESLGLGNLRCQSNSESSWRKQSTEMCALQSLCYLGYVMRGSRYWPSSSLTFCNTI